MWVVHQAEDPFVCFGAEPNKGLSSRSSMKLELGKGTPETSCKKEPREGSWRRETQEQSTTNIRSQSGEIESRGSEEDREDEFAVLSRQRSAVRKAVKDESAFQVACGSSAKNTRQR